MKEITPPRNIFSSTIFQKVVLLSIKARCMPLNVLAFIKMIPREKILMGKNLWKRISRAEKENEDQPEATPQKLNSQTTGSNKGRRCLASPVHLIDSHQLTNYYLVCKTHRYSRHRPPTTQFPQSPRDRSCIGTRRFTRRNSGIDMTENAGTDTVKYA